MEYGNFYEREDIFFMGLDPLRNYSLQAVITRARESYPTNPLRQKELVQQECSYYWPTEIDDPKIIEYAGLQKYTKNAMRDVYKEHNIQVAPNINCLVKVFYYQEKKWFYWWDMYKNSQLIKTGLEFFPWCDHPASYIIFATDPTQSPLMCTESFKHIRQF